MKLSTVLCVMAVFICVSFAQDVNNVITFRTTDKGLPWPLFDLDNYGLLAYHGVHCVQLLLSPHHDAKSDNDREMNSMHQEHCADIVRRMLNYVESVANYSVPAHVCMDMADWSKYEYIYLIGNHHVMQQTIDQYVQLYQLEATNFGRLLMAEHRGAPLTPAEATYLQKMFAPRAVRVGATGIYCQYGTSTVQTMSTAIQKQPQNPILPNTPTDVVAREDGHAK